MNNRCVKKGGNPMENMINALEQGWTVSEVARFLARGNNDEDQGFLVTMANYNMHASCRLYVQDSPESNDLLGYIMERPLAG
jgi:hypothetical protein